jgi:hypothetical protein
MLASAGFALAAPALSVLAQVSGTRCAGFALCNHFVRQQFLMMTTCALVILLYQTGEFVLAMDQAEGERRRRLPAG